MTRWRGRVVVPAQIVAQTLSEPYPVVSARADGHFVEHRLDRSSDCERLHELRELSAALFRYEKRNEHWS
jgi:hypothetical protein